jgi:hypothetical protein
MAAAPVAVSIRSDGRMAQPVSTQQQIAAVLPRTHRAGAVIAVAGAGLGAAILLGALVLWFHYGTAVFFEMIASGISACF